MFEMTRNEKRERNRNGVPRGTYGYGFGQQETKSKPNWVTLFPGRCTKMFGNDEGRKTGAAIRSTLYLSVLKPEELSGWTASETSVEDHSSSSSFRASRADFYARLQAGTDKQAKRTNTSKRTTERQTRTQTRTQTSRIILEHPPPRFLRRWNPGD
jgi:hypothetical protein